MNVFQFKWSVDYHKPLIFIFVFIVQMCVAYVSLGPFRFMQGGGGDHGVLDTQNTLLRSISKHLFYTFFNLFKRTI